MCSVKKVFFVIVVDLWLGMAYYSPIGALLHTLMLHISPLSFIFWELVFNPGYGELGIPSHIDGRRLEIDGECGGQGRFDVTLWKGTGDMGP